MQELDVEKTAKLRCETLKIKNGGVSRLRKKSFQLPKREFKTLFMILDYFINLSRIIVEIRGFGKRLWKVNWLKNCFDWFLENLMASLAQ